MLVAAHIEGDPAKRTQKFDILDRHGEFLRLELSQIAHRHIFGANANDNIVSLGEMTGDTPWQFNLQPPHTHLAPCAHLAMQEIHRTDEIRHIGAGGVAVNFHRIPDLCNTPIAHHHDPVSHGQGLLLIVSHHDGRDTQRALQILQFMAQLLAHLRIERT